MANTIKPKRSNTANKTPTTSDLSSGEFGVNMADQKSYINNGTSIVQVGAGKLSGLQDVNITTPSTGESLSWNGTEWVNSSAGSGTVTSVGITPSTGVTVSNSPITTSGNITVGLSNKLTAIENLSGAGFITQNGSGAIAGRTIQAGTGISVANGNGSSQDPTIAIDSTVATLTGTQTLSNKTLTNPVYTGTLTGGTGVVNLGSGQVVKDASGNVGIGGTPFSKLDVHGSTTIRGSLVATSTGFNNITLQGGTGNYTPIEVTNGTSTIAMTTNGGDTELRTITNSPQVFMTNNQERMRITSGGNVGIGTSSPGSKLHVYGNYISLADGSYTGYLGKASNVIASGGVSDLGLSAIGNLAFGTGGSLAERMRIDSSGNLLVGTTASAYGYQGNSFRWTENNVYCSVNQTTYRNQIVFFNPNGEVGQISTTGSATSYGTSSDYRLKENIAPMTGALDKVALLKPVTYNWKADGSDGQGFIAHELQAVVPDAVTGEKDAVDNEGKPVYQGIDTSFLVATLTAAIQELKALIENLTTRLTALEGK